MNALRLPALAERLGCSLGLIKRHVQRGNIRAVDIGTGSKACYIVPGDEVERIEREGLRKGPTAPKLRATEPKRVTHAETFAKYGM